MARPLRTLVALQRMWVQFPTPTWWFITITICSPFSRGFVPSNVLFRYQAHGCTNMNSGKTSIHKTKKEKLWLTGSLGHVIFVFEMFRNLFKFSQKEEQPAWWVSWHYRVFGRDGVNVSSVTHHSTSLVEVALVTWKLPLMLLLIFPSPTTRVFGQVHRVKNSHCNEVY